MSVTLQNAETIDIPYVEQGPVVISITEFDASKDHISTNERGITIGTEVPNAQTLIPYVSADNEWSLLKSVIVGRAENSHFPHEPPHMLRATMPPEHLHHFRTGNPFPRDIIQGADEELNNFATILQTEGIQVLRPENVNWAGKRGYTGAMVRDGLLVVGSTIIESCFAWQCRADEVSFSLGKFLSALDTDPAVRVVRAPPVGEQNVLYEGIEGSNSAWAINNNRPAFDAADFMRFGRTLIGQFSNVTNEKGVEYIRKYLPEGYKVEMLQVDDPHAMHIDATILPLRQRLLVYNPLRTTEEWLRRHEIFQDWELVPYPFVKSVEEADNRKGGIPKFMTSSWIVINVLVLGDNRVVIEENDEEFGGWLEKRGMRVIKAPFQNVNAIGGSFHCASLDLVRS